MGISVTRIHYNFGAGKLCLKEDCVKNEVNPSEFPVTGDSWLCHKVSGG